MATKSRKRHAPITDTDSDESLTASQSQSKSSVPKNPGVTLPPCRGLWGTLHIWGRY